MKNSKWNRFMIQNFIFMIVVSTFIGCSANGVQVKPYSSDRMVHYSQLSGYDESRNLNDSVFYVNAGETVPLKLSMETDFMDFKQDHIDIIAKQKLYFRVKMPENLSAGELEKLNKLTARSFSRMSRAQRSEFLKDYMLYVSRDAVHWAPLFGSRAYRKILGYKAGLLSFAILASTADGLGASLDIKTVK